MDYIHSIIDKITVQNVFVVNFCKEKKYRTFKNKQNVKLTIDSSSLNMILISPIFWNATCSEIMDVCSKILNNIGFLGERSTNCVEEYDKYFELMYF